MPLRSEVRRWMRKSHDDSWPEHFRWLARFYRWRRRAFLEGVDRAVPADVTAIILVYGRPQNAETLVHLLLRTPSVQRVVLSNNNRLIHIRDWLTIQDPRLVIIDQPVDRSCPYRHEIARRYESPFYLLVDDDLFLAPSQLEWVLGALRKDTSRVHGVQGQLFDPGTDAFLHNIRNRETPVDVVNRLYAFTRVHLREFFRLVDLLRFGPGSREWYQSMWDDMVLSFSGNTRPLVHEVGTFIDCPLSSDPTIAVWRQQGFFDFRVSLFHRLTALKSLSP
ncbi:MAG: hypothetical protein WC840_02450 [Candidatus Peribacteraceae bacterium]